jgi:hypothetical protein
MHIITYADTNLLLSIVLFSAYYAIKAALISKGIESLDFVA